MPTIKPISDLRNYSSVLRDVSETNPVYLTRNGRGCYALVDISSFERFNASLALLSDLAEGEESAQKGGWVSLADTRAVLQRTAAEKSNAR